MERKALIFNVQKYNIYDGPGVRTLIFFKGCPLRCKWCSNPESQLRQFQVMFKKNMCKNHGICASVCPVGIHLMSPDKIHSIARDIECIGCRKCEEACPQRAIAIVGEYRSISDLMEIIEEDRPFYESSGGGVTLSGGEVMMQPEAAVNLLMTCQQRGINTAIETSGYAPLETVMKFAEFTDLFLFDIKQMNSDLHYEYTGVHNDIILSNLQWLLENRYNVEVRLPTLKGINDSNENIEQIIEFLKPYQFHKNFKGVDLLPYHKYGVSKYNQLDIDYPLETEPVPTHNPVLTAADIERIENCFKQHDFPITVIEH